MPELRALLLDLDDTLIDDRGAMADAVLLFRGRHDLCDDEEDAIVSERWDTIGRELWRRMDLGEVSFSEQRRQRLRRTFNLTISDSAADELFESYLECYERSWRMLPGAESFLEQTSHLPRVIVTNGHRPQARRKLEQLGLAPVFDGVVTPDDCGVRKPDPGIFQHALGMLGLTASEAMMIGDNEEVDIAPALALGMRTFHVRTFESGFTIRDAVSALLL